MATNWLRMLGISGSNPDYHAIADLFSLYDSFYNLCLNARVVRN